MEQARGRLPEVVGEAYREDGEEAGVAEVVVVACDEGGEILLEAGILIDGPAADGRWNARVAGASGEADLKTGLAHIVEAEFYRDADAAFSARNDVSESETEAGRNLSELDAAGAAEGVSGTADVFLPVQRDGAAGRDDSRCKEVVVIGEDDLRAQVKMSAEGEPIERCVAGQHLKVGADVGALLLEIGGIGEEVDACAQVELSREGRGEVEANASQAYLRGEADL